MNASPSTSQPPAPGAKRTPVSRALNLTIFSCLLLLMGAACSPAPDKERVRVTAVTVPGTPWHDMWVRFGDNAAEMAPDHLEVELFVLSQFGPEENMIANVRRNRAQLAGLSLQGAAQVVPELNLILTPYLFESRAELDFVLDEYLIEPYRQLLEARGLTIVQWADVGWTHLYGASPLLEPSDVDGRRMRTSRAAGARVFGRALDMNQIVLPFTDVVPALQTGLVDGGQSGVGMYAMTGIAREAGHLTLTAHAYDAGLIVANADWWLGMDEQTRSILRDALDDVDRHRIEVRAMIAAIQNSLPDQGVAVHELTAEQRQRWAEASQDAAAMLIDQIGGDAADIYDIMLQGKAAFAERHPDAKPDYPR